MGTFPNGFQRAALDRLEAVLREHDLPGGRFIFKEDGFPRFVNEFYHEGREYLLEIYEDSIVMTSGDQLFEIYLTKEFASPETEIESFARRLDRYLSGGGWEAPEEQKGFFKYLIDSIRAWMRPKMEG